MASSAAAPKVFVSYSHDSSAHKQWVAKLAAELRAVGVDVVLDQWDISPGQDVTLFMEEGLSESERVLVICSEEYVRKADAGKGGVGYERMIVTAEILRDLGTKKFIPVVRQTSTEKILPKFMGSRFYVEMSEDAAFSEKVKELAREIHQAPDMPKPPLGRNPFPTPTNGASAQRATKVIADVAHLSPDQPEEIYREAVILLRQEDFTGWRQLIKRTKPAFYGSMAALRGELESNAPRDWDATILMMDAAISSFAPLMTVALAAVESGSPKFRDQRALVDDVLGISNWARVGLTKVVELPEAIVFLYQALHGAVCMDTSQLATALDLAEMKVASPFDDRRVPIWSRHEFVGWPKSLDGHCEKAWGYLVRAFGQWSWVRLFFSSEQDYLRGLVAYYMALNINELANLLAQGEGPTLKQQSQRVLKVPLEFAMESSETCNAALSLLTRDSAAISRTWERKGVSRPTFGEHWPAWCGVCSSWIFNSTHNFYKFPLVGLLESM